jgi:predicted metal-dependent hydrolase
MPIPEYTVTHSPKAKSIRLKVTLEEGLSVVIPRGFDKSKIPDVLHRKRDWIAEKLEEASEKRRFLEPRPTTYLPEQISLRSLGQEWRIVYQFVENKSGIAWRANERELVFSGSLFERDRVIAKLTQWLRLTVRDQLFPLVRSIAAKHGFSVGELMVKSQRTRWASCSAKKNLSLNTKLLFIPPDLVRYVIVHELCHTVHMNHSSEFWRLVANYEPSYRIHDQLLRDAWKQVPAWLMRK